MVPWSPPEANIVEPLVSSFPVSTSRGNMSEDAGLTASQEPPPQFSWNLNKWTRSTQNLKFNNSFQSKIRLHNMMHLHNPDHKTLMLAGYMTTLAFLKKCSLTRPSSASWNLMTRQ